LLDRPYYCQQQFYRVSHFNPTGIALTACFFLERSDFILGTITAKEADVYSYDEDDMVEDPNLAKHLSHWGINMMNMEKTDRSMADLEIDLNQKYGEASMIEEANSKLKPVHGGGYTGMKNLGNSCYMNSALQVLFTIKDFQEKYYKHCDFYFDNSKDPVNDFNTQTAKLAFGLLSGLYSREMPADSNPSFRPPSNIRPQMFRTLIGHGHAEFSTKQQQDAAEFLEYFNELVHKHCLKDPTPDASLDPSTCFQFQLEERIYCPETTQVRYLTRDDSMFRMSIPLDASKNMHEVLQYNKIKEDMEKQGKKINDLPIVRPIIPLTQAIARWAEPEKIEDFKIKRNGPKTTIRKTQRFLTFPDYLLIQLKKYTFNDDWTPRKLDISMEIPDELDLNSLRATGFQTGETPMPDGTFTYLLFLKIKSSIFF
jgi:ubiquitin carboxyl-terminal hydrolase 5/13